MNVARNALLLLAVILIAWSPTTGATTILVADGGGTLGYGYGYGSWTNMTAALNAASGNGVTVAPNFLNLAQMLSYDAIWLDQRWVAGVLNPNEAANISAFVSTGRKAVLMGENASWTAWDNQILGIVGGAFSSEYTGLTHPLIANDLTSGAPLLWLQASGTALGGAPLYDWNWATMWRTDGNVLTLLDVNVMDDVYWGMNNNGQFAGNVATWLCKPVVPEPRSLVLLGLGLGGLVVGMKLRRN